VIAIALAKDPKQRFASVQAFAKALEHACQEEFIPTVVSPPKDILTNLPPTVFARANSPDAPVQTPSQPLVKSESRIPPTILLRDKGAPSIAPLAVEKLAL